MAKGENHLTQADKEAIRTMREYQEKLDAMTPEERAKEEKIMDGIDRLLHLSELTSPYGDEFMS